MTNVLVNTICFCNGCKFHFYFQQEDIKTGRTMIFIIYFTFKVFSPNIYLDKKAREPYSQSYVERIF